MMMSGFCRFPTTSNPTGSHERCRLGGCPCACHLGEWYECGNCGEPLREAPLMENLDEPGEMVYVHIDPADGRSRGEEC